MYQFILNQWLLGKIDEAKVLSYSPKWISVEQAQTIINTDRAVE